MTVEGTSHGPWLMAAHRLPAAWAGAVPTPKAPTRIQPARADRTGPVAEPEPPGWATRPGIDGLLPSAAELARLRQVAAGEEEADLIVRGGRVMIVHNGGVVARDILIVGRYIAAVTKPGALAGRRSLDAAGRFVLPAYVDAGIRVEQTMLSPGELARLVVPRGTVTLLTDPSVLAELGGPRGLELASRTATPLRILVRTGQADLLPRQPDPSADLSDLSDPAGSAGDQAGGTEGGLVGAQIRTVTELATVGHLDHDVRVAIGQGMGPVEAVRRASFLPARAHGLDGLLGSITPSRFADLQVVSSLTAAVPPDVVVAGGRIAAERGRPLFDNFDALPGWAVGRIRLPANLHAGSFSTPGLRRAARRDASVAATSLENPRGGYAAIPQPVTGGTRWPLRMVGITPLVDGLARPRWEVRTVRVDPTVRAGSVVADPTRDLLKIAVFDWDGSAGGIDVGVLRGLGLTRGALAVTTTAAPGHLVVVGVRDDDMLTAVRAIEGMGGGFVVVDRGWVRAACPLSLLGVMSDAPWEAVLGELAAVDTAAADLGCRLPFPLRTLAALGTSLYVRP